MIVTTMVVSDSELLYRAGEVGGYRNTRADSVLRVL
jgi:hypothetical protein